MTNLTVNVSSNVEIKNNIWTLTKHVASSVNKAAAKVDAKVYGPIVKQGTVQLPPQPVLIPEPHHTGFFEGLGMIVFGIMGIGAFVAFIFTWQGRCERVGNKIWG